MDRWRRQGLGVGSVQGVGMGDYGGRLVWAGHGRMGQEGGKCINGQR